MSTGLQVTLQLEPQLRAGNFLDIQLCAVISDLRFYCRVHLIGEHLRQSLWIRAFLRRQPIGYLLEYAVRKAEGFG